MPDQPSHFQRVAAHYDKLAGRGPYATLAPHNRGGRKSEYVNAVFDAAILPWLADDACGNVLDFGCGTGSFTRVLADRCSRVTGVDVSEQMLQTASELCNGLTNVRLQKIDGSHLPFPQAEFDDVIARESLCYVPDDLLEPVLREMSRVLKPRGRLLWLEQVSNAPRWQRHPNVPNLVKRAPEDLRGRLSAAGFVLLDEAMVRTPRFPWIYPVWLGLVPRRLIPMLACREVAWHRRFGGLRRRWWNVLLIAERLA